MPFCNLFFFTLRPPRIFAKSLSAHDIHANVVLRKSTRTQHICGYHIASLWLSYTISWCSFYTVTAMQLRCWKFKKCTSKLQKHQFTIRALHLQMCIASTSNGSKGILRVFYCNFIVLVQHHEVQKCPILEFMYFWWKVCINTLTSAYLPSEMQFCSLPIRRRTWKNTLRLMATYFNQKHFF